jgi:hypothetical protein
MAIPLHVSNALLVTSELQMIRLGQFSDVIQAWNKRFLFLRPGVLQGWL